MKIAKQLVLVFREPCFSFVIFIAHANGTQHEHEVTLGLSAYNETYYVWVGNVLVGNVRVDIIQCNVRMGIIRVGIIQVDNVRLSIVPVVIVLDPSKNVIITLFYADNNLYQYGILNLTFIKVFS